MGTIRKPRCQTGRLNAAECRDAQERRSDGDVEKAMDGFFNNLLVQEFVNHGTPEQKVPQECPQAVSGVDRHDCVIWLECAVTAQSADASQRRHQNKNRRGP
jgi:hypothetical protein